MRLTRFRVRNYKSVRDSGYCWLASDLTVLAGKNESGKSAILEALRDFDSRESVPYEARPIDQSAMPLLECHFTFEPGELDEIFGPYSDALRKGLMPGLAKNGLTLFRDHDGQYRFDDDVSEAITQIDAQEAERAAKREKERADQLAREAAERAAAEAADGESDEEEEDDQEEEDVEEAVEEATGPPPPLLEAMVERLPRFVFFSSFEDVLPFQTTFRAARTKRSVQDFAKVAGLDLSRIAKIEDLQEKRNLLSARSAHISGNFKGYWRQDEISLQATAEGQTLIIGVLEGGSTYTFKVEQRSKGFQWFLSFYLRLHAEGGTKRVILIDEPGLYLHAKAQRDVLDVLENSIAREAQIVFSTHSPYLIDPDRFDRLRLVMKTTSGGTRIHGKIHAGADRETLTPIVTAIGLDLANEFSVAGRKNVILEGITDYFYLQALRNYLPAELHEGVTFIPCVGAQNVPQVASLLIGWGLDFVAVLDRDTEGKKVARSLKEKLLLPDDQVIFSHPDDRMAVEDLFTPGDFRKYVLGDAPMEEGDTNSRAAKRTTLDGALLARQFFQKVKSDPSAFTFRDTTIANAERLFRAISEGLAAQSRTTEENAG
jgi:predicted ATPase